MNTNQSESGFTLIEMMAVIVIAAIIFSIGVPSFDDIIKRNNVEGMQMKLASSVSTARSEAASRNTPVSMCASANATTCGGTWSNGWITFEDHDSDGVFDSSEILIDVYEHANEYAYAATDNSGSTVSRMTFSAKGYMQGTTATLFTICEPNKRVQYARGVYVSGSGMMVKTSDGADSDANHDNPFSATSTDPQDLTCT